MSSKKRRLVHRMINREFRKAYREQHSTIGLPFQIRAMRDARGWTQRQLGERAGMVQETISLLENPGYGKFTIRTLNRLADAFDVGLLVRFVPFSRMIQEMTDVEPEQLAVPSFDSDKGLVEVLPELQGTAAPTLAFRETTPVWRDLMSQPERTIYGEHWSVAGGNAYPTSYAALDGTSTSQSRLVVQ